MTTVDGVTLVEVMCLTSRPGPNETRRQLPRSRSRGSSGRDFPF